MSTPTHQHMAAEKSPVRIALLSATQPRVARINFPRGIDKRSAREIGDALENKFPRYQIWDFGLADSVDPQPFSLKHEEFFRNQVLRFHFDRTSLLGPPPLSMLIAVSSTIQYWLRMSVKDHHALLYMNPQIPQALWDLAILTATNTLEANTEMNKTAQHLEVAPVKSWAPSYRRYLKYFTMLQAEVFVKEKFGSKPKPSSHNFKLKAVFLDFVPFELQENFSMKVSLAYFDAKTQSCVTEVVASYTSYEVVYADRLNMVLNFCLENRSPVIIANDTCISLYFGECELKYYFNGCFCVVGNGPVQYSDFLHASLKDFDFSQADIHPSLGENFTMRLVMERLDRCPDPPLPLPNKDSFLEHHLVKPNVHLTRKLAQQGYRKAECELALCVANNETRGARKLLSHFFLQDFTLVECARTSYDSGPDESPISPMTYSSDETDETPTSPPMEIAELSDASLSDASLDSVDRRSGRSIPLSPAWKRRVMESLVQTNYTMLARVSPKRHCSTEWSRPLPRVHTARSATSCHSAPSLTYCIAQGRGKLRKQSVEMSTDASPRVKASSELWDTIDVRVKALGRGRGIRSVDVAKVEDDKSQWIGKCKAAGDAQKGEEFGPDSPKSLIKSAPACVLLGKGDRGQDSTFAILTSPIGKGVKGPPAPSKGGKGPPAPSQGGKGPPTPGKGKGKPSFRVSVANLPLGKRLRMNLIPADKLKNTIWERVDTSCAEILDGLDKFKVQVKQSARRGSEVQVNIAEVTLLDARRAQNIAIVMARLPHPAQFAEKIQKMDTSALSLGDLSKYAEIVPNQEECRLFMEFLKNGSQEGRMRKVELDLLPLAQISKVEERIRIMKARIQLPSTKTTLENMFQVYVQAATEIRNSSTWAHVLRIVLVISHYINTGEKEMQGVEGVPLGALASLTEIKEPETNQTLVHHVARQLTSAELENLAVEMKHVRLAAKIAFANAMAGILQIKGEASWIAKEIEHFSDEYGEELGILEEVQDELRVVVKVLTAQHEACVEEVQNAYRYFAVDDATDEHEWFTMLDLFLKHLKDAGVDIQRERRSRCGSNRSRRASTCSSPRRGLSDVGKRMYRRRSVAVLAKDPMSPSSDEMFSPNPRSTSAWQFDFSPESDPMVALSALFPGQHEEPVGPTPSPTPSTLANNT